MHTMRGMKHLGKAVRNIRVSKGLRLEDVANSMARYDAGNLSRFERQLQDIEGDKLQEVCRILGTNLSELATLAEQLDCSHEVNDAAPAQYIPSTSVETRLPDTLQSPYAEPPKKSLTEVFVVPVYKGEHLTALAEKRAPPPTMETIRSARDDTSPADFAWRVSDDSMTAGPGTEVSYPIGAFAIFDPHIDYISGDCVLVNLGGENNAFTQIVNAGGRWMMVPLNKAYPARDLPAGAKVIAVAISVQLDTRRTR